MTYDNLFAGLGVCAFGADDTTEKAADKAKTQLTLSSHNSHNTAEASSSWDLDKFNKGDPKTETAYAWKYSWTNTPSDTTKS